MLQQTDNSLITRQEFNISMSHIDRRFEAIEHRLAKAEERLERVERRLDKVEERLERVERRLDAIETRLDALEERLDRHVEALMEDNQNKVAVIIEYFDSKFQMFEKRLSVTENMLRIA
jgi:predicted  nucleic acid-binding Zn-ribbon protein